MMMNSSLIADVSFKLILIGDSAVGKSALISRFKNDNYYENSRSTVGVEFTKRAMKFKKTNQNIQVHLWDTAGQERYKSITKQHYRGADSAIVVFDLDKPRSFESVMHWLDEVKDNTPNECVVAILGNKADIETEKTRYLSREAANFAKENRLPYYETSALWSRTHFVEGSHNKKGIENVLLDIIEGVSIVNPKKALGVYEQEDLFDNEYIDNQGSNSPKLGDTFSSTVINPNLGKSVIQLSHAANNQPEEPKEGGCCGF